MNERTTAGQLRAMLKNVSDDTPIFFSDGDDSRRELIVWETWRADGFYRVTLAAPKHASIFCANCNGAPHQCLCWCGFCKGPIPQEFCTSCHPAIGAL